MAQLEKYIPFVIRFEAGVTDSTGKLTARQLFEKARKAGFANDPSDLGGATQTGVTLAAYNAYLRSIGRGATDADGLKAIPYDHWLAILKRSYWDAWKADSIRSQSVAEALVDWTWCSGRKYGIGIPQRILGVDVDNIVGAKTLAAVNSTDPRQLFADIKRERLAFTDRICQTRPANKKFRKGWVNRIEALKYVG